MFRLRRDVRKCSSLPLFASSSSPQFKWWHTLIHFSNLSPCLLWSCESTCRFKQNHFLWVFSIIINVFYSNVEKNYSCYWSWGLFIYNALCYILLKVGGFISLRNKLSLGGPHFRPWANSWESKSSLFHSSDVTVRAYAYSSSFRNSLPEIPPEVVSRLQVLFCFFLVVMLFHISVYRKLLHITQYVINIAIRTAVYTWLQTKQMNKKIIRTNARVPNKFRLWSRVCLYSINGADHI